MTATVVCELFVDSDRVREHAGMRAERSGE